MTTEELAVLITAFRKETEDLFTSLMIQTFLVKYGETTYLGEETQTIVLAGDAYANDTDYEIEIFEAIDADGVNIKDALILTERNVGNFKLYSPVASVVRWQTHRRAPLINFWT